ncbi:uncharacterized protein LOC111131268 [Crassostrea virginica]|uniref:Glutaredoxin-1-like n=1 Tax=Crassostrea virginica TaxID=6565 RepID=A0A8B8E3Y0_CRAVI|nr:glutaredoxin-1-like [Crassostrea virginica]
MSVAAAIEEKIASKKVVVYSKPSCPYCKKAKQVFLRCMKKGWLTKEEYEVVEIDSDPQCVAIQTYMQKKTGARTVPRVFIKGKFAGGGDDIISKDNSGQLEKMLK